MNQPAQSYANHVRQPPALYYAACAALVLGALGFLWVTIRQPGLMSVSGLLTALGAGGAAWYARINPLRVQDRVVRIEERVRFDRILPGELKGRIDEFEAWIDGIRRRRKK